MSQARMWIAGLGLAVALTAVPASGSPLADAHTALRKEVEARQAALGGDLAARTAEFKALRRGARALTQSDNKFIPKRAGQYLKLTRELEGALESDGALMFRVRELLGCLDAGITGLVDNAEFELVGMQPNGAQVKALNFVGKAEDALKSSRQSGLSLTGRAKALRRAAGKYLKVIPLLARARKAAKKPGNRVPKDLPPGKYQLFFAVNSPNAFTFITNIRLRNKAEFGAFRKALTVLINQSAKGLAQQNKACDTAVGSTPFNGNFFTITMFVDCPGPGGSTKSTEIIYRVNKAD